MDQMLPSPSFDIPSIGKNIFLCFDKEQTVKPFHLDPAPALYSYTIFCC